MEDKKIISRENINDRFKDLLNGEDFSVIINEVPNIKAEYDEAHRMFYQEQQDTFLKNQEEKKSEESESKESDPDEKEKKEEATFKFEADEHSHRFKELYTIFLDKKKEYKKALAQKEEDNFKAKTDVIEQMKALTEQELKNFGETFNTFKELQEKWKSVGDVNKARFQTLQTEYSHLMDKFFYNVNIHKSLQNYSFEKNNVEKKSVIEKLKELIKNDSIIQLEHYIKLYQKEWDEIGPTFQEEWDKIKDEYWTSVNAVYGKIREHYLKIREKQKESIEKKEAIIVQAQELVIKLKETESPSKWNDLSNKVKELQQNWRKTGFSKKNKDDELWASFREVTNEFFDFTKSAYNELNEKRDVFEEKKKVLIEKAKAMSTSTEWRDTTAKYLKLQEDWKKTGTIRPQKDQKMWNAFRKACNLFFDAKKEFFGGMDERQETNLKTKIELSKSISSSKNVEDLKENISKWWAVGHVPKKAIKSSTSDFDKAFEKASKALKLDDNVKEEIVFAAKIESYKSSENADKLLEGERRFVKEKINKIKDEVNQFENNLSFFGESKGAQKLKEVVQKRIADSQAQLESWTNKLKQIR